MTDNELIAKFMDYEFINDAPKDFPNGYWVHYEGDDWMTTDDFKYKESWDWIMPVVIKARDWWQNQEGEIRHEAERLLEHVLPSLWVIDIKSTHRRIVKFIKWYYDA